MLPEPFDSDDWIFALKYDGFRAIAEVRGTACRLYSRNRNVYKRFPTVCRDVAASIKADTVLDGEIVCFYNLLRRRGDLVFVAFDILELNGRDLRNLPLIERKPILRSVVPKTGPVLYAGHIDGRGTDLYRETCRRDLEGMSRNGSTAATCPATGNRLIAPWPGSSTIRMRFGNIRG